MPYESWMWTNVTHKGGICTYGFIATASKCRVSMKLILISEEEIFSNYFSLDLKEMFNEYKSIDYILFILNVQFVSN